MKIAKKFVYPGDPDKRYVTLGFLDKWIDGSTLHPGIDVNWVVGGRRGDADLGKQITATAAGEIVYSKDGRGGFGKHIWIKHKLPDGSFVYSHYAHLDKRWIAEGQEVDCGQGIGTCGNTGNAQGAHLHFEITTAELFKKYGPNAWPKGWSIFKIKSFYFDPPKFIQARKDIPTDWKIKYENLLKEKKEFLANASVIHGSPLRDFSAVLGLLERPREEVRNDMLKKLEGKKTYIVALVVGIVTALKVAGVIDNDTYLSILGFLGAIGLYTTRDAIKKIEK